MAEIEETPVVFENDDVIILTDMISKGLDVNSEYQGISLLSLALEKHATSCAELLIRSGADVDSIDSHGHSPLTHLCYQTENYSHEIYLLVSEWADVNEKDFAGHTPLIAATVVENIPNMEALISLGADLEICTNLCAPAVLYAAAYRNFQALKCLIKHNATLEADHFPNYPLMICLQYHTTPALMDQYMPIFIEAGANLNSSTVRCSPFLQCIINENVKWSQSLLDMQCLIFNRKPAMLDKCIAKSINMCAMCFHYDDNTNMCERCFQHDKLNKLLFASGEQFIITPSSVAYPHRIVQDILSEHKHKTLMQCCRSIIRKCMCLRGISFYSQVNNLPLPRIMKNYLLYR